MHTHHDHHERPDRGRRHHDEDWGRELPGEGPRVGRGPRGGRGGRGFGPGFGPDFGPGPDGERGPRRGGGRGRGGGPHRAPRGDVRTAVLLLLQEEPMHGYQLMQTIAERTGGRWSPSPGAIYPTLSLLEDEGLVATEKEGGRKLASLTDAGRRHVEESSSSWSNPFPGQDPHSDEERVDLRSLMFELRGAVREVGRAGSEAQIAEAAEILESARARMYRILAGETPPATGS
ncbi:PadR family transcriptional regulator [Brachybacterium phenoliresistens]|uniref:PadR family transcriptional regulator n=1 Tax=Brachybacterium phenoliresistens TaxID=396014 RepID=UPI0031D634D7